MFNEDLSRHIIAICLTAKSSEESKVSFLVELTQQNEIIVTHYLTSNEEPALSCDCLTHLNASKG